MFSIQDLIPRLACQGRIQRSHVLSGEQEVTHQIAWFLRLTWEAWYPGWPWTQAREGRTQTLGTRNPWTDWCISQRRWSPGAKVYIREKFERKVTTCMLDSRSRFSTGKGFLPAGSEVKVWSGWNQRLIGENREHSIRFPKHARYTTRYTLYSFLWGQNQPEVEWWQEHRWAGTLQARADRPSWSRSRTRPSPWRTRLGCTAPHSIQQCRQAQGHPLIRIWLDDQNMFWISKYLHDITFDTRSAPLWEQWFCRWPRPCTGLKPARR